MNELAVAFTVLLFLGQSPAEVSPPAPLQLVQIPNQDVIAQIRRFLPDAAVTRTLPLEVFGDLVARGRRGVLLTEAKTPTVVRTLARVDVLSGRLEGDARFDAPLGTASRWRIPHWNAKVLEVQDAKAGAAALSWGMDPTGSLVVAGVADRTQSLRVRWELAPVRDGSDWSYSINVADFAIAELDIELPPGRAFADPQAAQRLGSARTYRMRAQDGKIEFRLVAAEDGNGSDAVYSVATSCEVYEEEIRIETRLVIDVLHRPIESVSLLVGPYADRITILSGVGGDWKFEPAGEGLGRWLRQTSLGVGRHELTLGGRLAFSMGQPWSPPSVLVEGAVFTGEKIDIVMGKSLGIRSIDPGRFVLELPGVDDEGRYRLRLRGSQTPESLSRDAASHAGEVRSTTRPILDVEPTRSRLEYTQRMRWDLAKRPFEIVASFDFLVREGSLAQLRFQLPPQWRFASAKVHPPDRAAAVRSQPAEDGSTVWLALNPPLTAAEALRVEISAFLTSDLESAVREFRIPAPQVTLIDPKAAGTGEYEIILDPSYACTLEDFPPPRLSDQTADSGSAPTALVFPLWSVPKKAGVVLSPPQPRFRASLRQDAQWIAENWHFQWNLDLDVSVDGRDTFHLSTTSPLPDDLHWDVVGAQDASVRMEPSPATGIDVPMDDQSLDPTAPPDASRERRDYLLEISVPLAGRVQLRSQWQSRQSDVTVPLAFLPDADEFWGVVKVRSPSGRVIDVQSVGLPPKESEVAEEHSDGVVWMGLYGRLPPNANLRLKTSVKPPVSTSANAGRAVIHSRSTITSDNSVHDLWMQLEAEPASPLRVELPEDAYVWQVDLDGQSLEPSVTDGVVEVSPTLSAGVHQCRIVYCVPTHRWLGLVDAEITAPLRGWDVVCFLWTIEHDGMAYTWEDANLSWRSSLRMLDVSDARSPVVLLARGENVDRALAIADSTFSAWRRGPAASLEDYAERLGRALPVGWQVIIDRDVRVLPGRELARASSLADWLAMHGIALFVDQETMLLTSRVARSLSSRPRNDWDIGRWVRDLAREVASHGMDDSGRFRSPAGVETAAQRATLPVASLADLTSHRSQFVLVDFNAGPSHRDSVVEKWEVLLLPTDLLNRLSRTLTLVGVASVLFFARSWSRESHRRLLGALLLGALGVAVVGGVAYQALSLPLWASMGAGVLLLLRRSWLNRAIPATVVILGVVGIPEARADEPISLRRVLIPSDADGRPIGRAILSEELARRLEDAASRPGGALYVRRLTLEGRPDETRSRWTAVLEGVLEGVESPSKRIQLAFVAIEPASLRVDGSPLPWTRLANQEGIALVLPENRVASGGQAPRAIRIELEFDVVSRDAARTSSIAFGVPPAAQTIVRFRPTPGDWELDPVPRAVGWRSQADEMGQVFTLETGPISNIDLRLSRAPFEESNEGTSAEWVQLLEVTADRIDWSAHLRLDVMPVPSDLRVTIPSDVIVTSIGDGGSVWSVEPLESSPGRQRIRLDPTLVGGPTVVLRGVVVRSTDRIEAAPLAIEGVRTARGIVAIRLPEGGTAQVVESRNMEESSLAAFSAQWGRLEQGPAPTAIELVRRVDSSTNEQAFAIQWRTASPKLDVRQSHRLEIDPYAGEVRCQTSASFSLSGAATGLFQAKIPRGLTISHVFGPALHQWFVQGDELYVLTTAPREEEFTVSIESTLPGEATNLQGKRRVDYLVGALQWRNANLVENDWKVSAPTGWELTAPNATVNGNPHDDKEWSFQTRADALALSIDQVPQELDVAAYTFLTVRGRETTMEGRFDVRSTRGPLRSIEVVTPIGFKEESWQSEGWMPHSSKVRGEERIWTFASRLATQTAVLRWKTTVVSGTARIIPPVMKVANAARVSAWVAVANPAGQTLELETSGLTESSLPEPFAQWRPGGDSRANWQIRAYEAQQPWQLVVPVNQRTQASKAFVLLDSQVDLYETPDGVLYGEAHWKVLDLASGVYEIELPAEAAVQGVLVDGVSLPDAHVNDGTVEIPIFRKGRIQDLALRWKRDIPPLDGPVGLPRLVTQDDASVLVRVRHPKSSVWSSPTRLDRVQWLLKRLERNVEQMRIAASRKESLDEQTLRALSIQSQAIENEILLAGPLATPAVRKSVEVLTSSRQTIAAIDLSDQDAALGAPWDFPTAESTSWLETSSAQPRLNVEIRRFGSGRIRTANEWLRIAVAALALSIVLTRPAWDAMRLYWPAPIFTAGIAWWLFADTSFIGLALIGLALAGAARSIHRWFEGNFTDIASTLMHRSTRWRLALERPAGGDSVRRRSEPRATGSSARGPSPGSSVSNRTRPEHADASSEPPTPPAASAPDSS